MVYFDKRQWANLTRGLKPTDKKPPKKRGVTLELTTLPWVEGGFVQIICPVGAPTIGPQGIVYCSGGLDVTLAA